MATVSEVTTRPVAGYNHVDALLGDAIPWNYLGRNTIYYSFALDTGGDPNGVLLVPGTLSAFNANQQAQVRVILAEVSRVTGISFTEVPEASWADLHFANADLKNGYTSQDAHHVGYSTQGDQAANLRIHDWIYLDVYDDAFDNLNPLPGGSGYEALLHEIGHALGLKHPAEGPQRLPAGDWLGADNSATTLMSDNAVGGPYTTFNVYDLAALAWLYGGDGLGGVYGIGAPGQYLVGSLAADTLRGAAGNDIIDGGAGIDTVLYAGALSSYTVSHTASGFRVSGQGSGTDNLLNVERLAFGDGMRMALDVTGNGGMAYRLYQAAFDRAPDLPGLGYHIANLDRGVYIGTVAAHFVESPEFSRTYGTLSNEQFVRQLYLNVLHREGESAGVAYHVYNLQTTHARADVLVGFSESPENQAALIGRIQDGMPYILP